MSGTPRYKIYDPAGRYLAAVADSTLAAVMVSVLADGSRVKLNGRIVWREGSEVIQAGESYDQAAEIMDARLFRSSRRHP
jgi:hypothetical protein